MVESLKVNLNKVEPLKVNLIKVESLKFNLIKVESLRELEFQECRFLEARLLHPEEQNIFFFTFKRNESLTQTLIF